MSSRAYLRRAAGRNAPLPPPQPLARWDRARRRQLRQWADVKRARFDLGGSEIASINIGPGLGRSPSSAHVDSAAPGTTGAAAAAYDGASFARAGGVRLDTASAALAPSMGWPHSRAGRLRRQRPARPDRRAPLDPRQYRGVRVATRRKSALMGSPPVAEISARRPARRRAPVQRVAIQSARARRCISRSRRYADRAGDRQGRRPGQPRDIMTLPAEAVRAPSSPG